MSEAIEEKRASGPDGEDTPPWDATPPPEAYEDFRPDASGSDDASSEDRAWNLWDRRASLGPLLSHEPPGRSWLYAHRLEAGRGAVLAGIGGSSKTRAMYYLGTGAVIGRVPWGWTVSKTGSALLLLTEDTQRDLHETLHPICRELEVSDQERQLIEQRLHAFPLAGDQYRLLDTADGKTLMRTKHYRDLQELILSLGDVVFVGIDPALAVTAGDELDQAHQRELGKAIDDLAVNTGAAVMLVSHATKGSLGQDELPSHSSRGGGAITDAVRAEFAMRTMTAKEALQAGITDREERKRHVQFVATKGNHMPPSAFVPVWLRRGRAGVLIESDIRLDGASKGPSQRDHRALAVLVRMQQTRTPKLFEWRDQCVAEGIVAGETREAEKKAMQRVTGSLRQAGFIQQGMGPGYWVPTDDGIEEVSGE